MPNSQPKLKMSMFTVTILFLLLYIGTLSASAFIAYKLIYPKIINQQAQKKILDDASQVNTLLSANKIDEAMILAQSMQNSAETNTEKAFAYQALGFVFSA